MAVLEQQAIAEQQTINVLRTTSGWAVLSLCCIAQFMVVLDVTIVNVALPQMKTGLDLSSAGQQWVINA